jgi:non-ribosomal peptide synthetase component E (peptide arylation enzyme)
VHQAIAVAVSGNDGLQSTEKKIHAFWTACTGAPKDADLAAYLGARLPSFMIPASTTRLETFPLTANGKVDRNQLQAAIAAPSPALGGIHL